MNVYEFLCARIEERRDVLPLLPRDLPERVQPHMQLTDAGGHPILTTRQTARQDVDSLVTLLSIHRPDEDDGGCTGCGLGYTGDRLVEDVDDCPVLHALAWRWHRHADWQGGWTVPASVPVTTWPPGENCYCGGPEEIYPHRRGAGRSCRGGT